MNKFLAAHAAVNTERWFEDHRATVRPRPLAAPPRRAAACRRRAASALSVWLGRAGLPPRGLATRPSRAAARAAEPEAVPEPARSRLAPRARVGGGLGALVRGRLRDYIVLCMLYSHAREHSMRV